MFNFYTFQWWSNDKINHYPYLNSINKNILYICISFVKTKFSHALVSQDVCDNEYADALLKVVHDEEPEGIPMGVNIHVSIIININFSTVSTLKSANIINLFPFNAGCTHYASLLRYV